MGMLLDVASCTTAKLHREAPFMFKMEECSDFRSFFLSHVNQSPNQGGHASREAMQVANPYKYLPKWHNPTAIFHWGRSHNPSVGQPAMSSPDGTKSGAALKNTKKSAITNKGASKQLGAKLTQNNGKRTRMLATATRQKSPVTTRQTNHGH